MKHPLVGELADATLSMSRLRDARIAFRLPIVVAGMLLAMGNRTASRWFQCASVKDDWDRFYELLASVGRGTSSLMLPLVVRIVRRFDPGPDGLWKLALDDYPMQRHGRHVEGANVHHNPTPEPAHQTWLYGHNLVCLAFLLTHPLWGVLALPVLSTLYVRREDVAKLRARYGKWKFQTKRALELAREVIGMVRALGSQVGWLVIMDGGYAAGKLLRSLLADGVQIITRLRRDAQLFDLPTPTVDKDYQHELATKERNGDLNAMAVEREARRLKNRTQEKRISAGRGAVRRFVIGTATVEVQFRKREAVPADVANVLRRAAEMAEADEPK